MCKHAPVATIVTDDGTVDVDAVARPGTLLLSPDSVRAVTGWELKPEGLCRGEVCIPVPARAPLEIDGRVDLRAVAELLRRPFAIDDETQAAALGASAATRCEELNERAVGDFTLHDVNGHAVQWSSFGRKKKVLVAWASW